MGHLSVFLNTEIVNSGILAAAANGCLAPLRYICEGKKILIGRQHQPFPSITIHRVSSFHGSGAGHISKSLPGLHSSSTHWIKATLAIALVIPGLLLGSLLKALTYLSANVRINHAIVKDSLAPIIMRSIGTLSNPITSEIELINALQATFTDDPLHRPTETLIIYGDGALTLRTSHAARAILRLNPQKLFLINASIGRGEPGQIFDFGDMLPNHKWQVLDAQTPDDPRVAVHTANDFAIAYSVPAPLRNVGKTWKCMHLIWQINSDMED